jgi:hypothetical protein
VEGRKEGRNKGRGKYTRDIGPIYGYLGPRNFPGLRGGIQILMHMSKTNIKSNVYIILNGINPILINKNITILL